MDLERLIEDYLEYLEIEKNSSPLTIRDYRHYLTKFRLWSERFSPITKPQDINQEIVRKFRVYLAHKEDQHGLTLKRITQNYYIIALRAFLRFLVRRDIDVLAPEKIELPKAESRSLKFLEREQVERLMGMPDTSQEPGMRDRAILELFFSTGLRVSELCSLNRETVNIERQEFGVIGKGRKARVVFLSDRASEWVARYLAMRKDTYKPLFIRYSGGEDDQKDGEKMRLTSRSVQRLVEKYVKQAKLPLKITPHGMRHSFATDLLINGADLRSVQEMLGHKNVATTQIYTHVTNAQLKDVHKAFHSGNKHSE